MLVKIKHQMSGGRNGAPWPGPGEVLDMPDDEAAVLIRNGMATEVLVERAVPADATVETRATATARKTVAPKPTK